MTWIVVEWISLESCLLRTKLCPLAWTQLLLHQAGRKSGTELRIGHIVCSCQRYVWWTEIGVRGRIHDHLLLLLLL